MKHHPFIIKFNILTIRYIKKKKKRKANIEIDPPTKKKRIAQHIFLKCCMFSTAKPKRKRKKKTVNGKIQ